VHITLGKRKQREREGERERESQSHVFDSEKRTEATQTPTVETTIHNTTAESYLVCLAKSVESTHVRSAQLMQGGHVFDEHIVLTVGELEGQLSLFGMLLQNKTVNEKQRGLLLVLHSKRKREREEREN
jgi:hypothetical protein